uniref:G-protein coupled receptors family 1 profile domain-containing protein n=1 Tax=Gallus gallus TaxID=9031 RepID=A0A8V0XBE3_CHICK
MPNSSSISEFLLLALADTRQLQLLHFWLLLGIYLAALLGNGLISTAVACDHRLHTPMYFFLLNLALLDLGCISTTLPKAMANALWHTRAISYAGCAAQVFFFVFFLAAEYSILTIMSYDRYVAICKPLHYGTLLGSRACATMAAAAWEFSGALVVCRAEPQSHSPLALQLLWLGGSAAVWRQTQARTRSGHFCHAGRFHHSKSIVSGDLLMAVPEGSGLL